jgi:hypothetical protein
MNSEEIISRLKAARVPHETIANALGRARPAASNLLSGKRSLKAHEIAPLVRLLEEHGKTEAVSTDGYVAVEVIPTYAGAGGGGTGDGYVLKNIERIDEGLRVFSSNPKYRERMLSGDDSVRIIGRPAWIGRRL